MNRLFYIDPADIDGNRAVVRGPDARHIRHTLRMKTGDTVGLLDGRGTVYQAQVEAFEDQAVVTVISDRNAAKGEPPVEIRMAQGFLKEKKMDTLVRQLTELGMAAWQPFICRRSIARPDGRRLESRRLRWQTIAKEAAKQCRRGIIPDIGPTVSFENALELAAGCDLKIVFWEEADQPLGTGALTTPEARNARIFVMTGPEGGFEPQEIAAARRAGFRTASLGPRILRAETAALTACSLVQHIFGDLG